MRDPTAWVIVNRHGDILTSTIAGKRVKAIKRMTGSEDGYGRRWRWWYRCCGCRAVRVRLVRMEGGDG